jgi:hypothetical protein
VLECDDADYKAMLYMAGRSMRNMLEYIRLNYKSHFSGITIDSIARMGIDLNESKSSSAMVTPKSNTRKASN